MRAYKKLMSVRQISSLTWLFLIPAGVLVSLYTSLGVIGSVDIRRAYQRCG